MIKRIVCLANSRKIHGRCVAGREFNPGNPGGWIRPVSDREHEEVSEVERQYEDGSDPRVLDIIDVPLLESRPRPYQPENWLLDPKWYWNKVGEFRRENLRSLTESPETVWVNGYDTRNGLNDYVPVENAANVDGSLKLIAVNSLELHVYRPGETWGNPKRRVQARFSFNGIDYYLWVTDPQVETRYLAQADGVYDLGSSYLTISLGEPLDGRCYKLVATIIGASP